MTEPSNSLAARLQRLEDLAAIGELIARYALAVDDRDLDALGALFTPDGVFRSKDGVMDARGRGPVLEQFQGRFRALAVSNHFSHDRILTLGKPRGAAHGLVTAHAEVWRNGRALIAALRYEDTYRLHEDRWCFAERLLSFLYYLPVEEYAQGLGDRMRMRAYGDRRPADYPESLPNWQLYHGGD